MALFKIHNNFEVPANQRHTVTESFPARYTAGFCYFDATNNKFWVDIEGSGGSTGTRVPLNALRADVADIGVRIPFATCSTPASTETKQVQFGAEPCPWVGTTIPAGTMLAVYFLYGNTAEDPRIQLDKGTATGVQTPIYLTYSKKAGPTVQESWDAGSVCVFTYIPATASGKASAEWVMADYQTPPIDNDTTYTFTSGTTGNFTVTPLGGTAQTVSIGKPATAGAADSATTATKFNTTRVIELLGDVTGDDTSDGTAGWSINTTIGEGKVTNAMLAGSIANNKLAHSTIGIAGNTLNLGDTLSKGTLLSSLGLSNSTHFIGVATVAITDGSSTDPVITGYNVTTDRQVGDIILDVGSTYEYIWTNDNKWERFGGDSVYKLTQTPVDSDSDASTAFADNNTSPLIYISRITQDAQGQIATYRNTIPTASTSAKGVIQITETNTNSFINTLTAKTRTETPQDNDYFISQAVGGGTTTTTYFRRPMTSLWDYIFGKMDPSWESWVAGTTSGPQAVFSIGNQDYTSAAIPSAASDASGVVTTGAQVFAGDKSFIGGLGTGTDTEGSKGFTLYRVVSGSNPLYGSWLIDTFGTSSADGKSILTVGNSTASGTANNAAGEIMLYSAGAGGTKLVSATSTNTYTATLQGKTGTVAYLSDISDECANYLPLAGGEMFGDITVKTNNSISLGATNMRWKSVFIGTADTYGSNTQPVYWNAGVPTALTYTANRLYYSASTTSFAATGHYASSTQISIGRTTAPASGTALHVTGDLALGDAAATRNIYYQGTNTTNSMIRFRDNSSNNDGNGIAIGGGGGVLIGAGTCATGLTPSVTNKDLYLLADNSIYIEASYGANSVRTGIQIDTNGDVIPVAEENDDDNLQYLGSSTAHWAGLYVGANDSYGSGINPIYWDDGVPTPSSSAVGDAYTPVYLNDGTITATSPVQQMDFSIANGTYGVQLNHTAFTTNSYVIAMVVDSGAGNLNSGITWTSGAGFIKLTCTSAVSGGAVSGYIIVARGTKLTATSTTSITTAPT